MNIRHIGNEEAGDARGVVVVIDVIRAFSVAAYALAGGAAKLWMVRTTEDAFALRELRPDALLAGEIRGRLIPGFDLNNSPALMAKADVRDRLIIQRTGAGTQGAVACVNAAHLFPCSLVNARATAAHVAALAREYNLSIALFPTGWSYGEFEDVICAEYLEALLAHPADAQGVLEDGLGRLHASGRFERFTSEDGDFPAEDVPAVLAVDRFSFAMVGTQRQLDGVAYVETVRLDSSGDGGREDQFVPVT
ncbi:MAG: hypothetical protein NVS4B3_28470 [Gemmatimonadaceae bacterium]